MLPTSTLAQLFSRSFCEAVAKKAGKKYEVEQNSILGASRFVYIMMKE